MRRKAFINKYHLKLIYLSITLVISAFQISYSQIPQYYSRVNFNQSSENVKTQLANLITTTQINELDYTPDVWNALMITDLDPSDTSNQNVLLIYGYDDTDGNSQADRTRDKNMNCDFSGDCSGYWNREHVYPRSLGTPNLGFENAGADAHALRACDSEMNSSRSNRKFALGTGDSHITPQGDWYPGDEWKGDVARMMMYMYLRYPTQAVANNVAVSSNNNHPDMPDIFLQWNVEDPVDTYETQRNDHLEIVQGNRNPFIDNPYLATVIWGGDNAENTWQELSVGEFVSKKIFVYPNPSTGNIYFETNKNFISIQVYSITGNKVLDLNDQQVNKLDLSKLEGVYILFFRFRNEDTYYQKLFIN